MNKSKETPCGLCLAPSMITYSIKGNDAPRNITIDGRKEVDEGDYPYLAFKLCQIEQALVNYFCREIFTSTL
jgi:hypothetical protein